MTKKRRLIIFNGIMTVNAFFIALISLLGVIFKSDTMGRLIFGATWILIGSWWIFQLIQNLKKHDHMD